jgi:hypothetical protein
MSVLKGNNLLFDPSFSHAEDYELWTRIAKVSKLANLQQILYKVRLHENEVSRIYSSTQIQNSLRIKHREFETLGVTVTNADIELYTRIAQYEYSADKKFVTDSKILLEKLVAANNKTKHIEPAFFSNALSEFWFNVTYNSGLGWWAYKQYLSSWLCTNKQIGLKQKAKFILKGIL